MRQIKSNTLCLLLIVWLINACSFSSGVQNDKPKIDAFFDLEGLVNQQIEKLSSFNPRVRKEATINGQEEVQDLDSLNWKKELHVFLKADINKPRLLSQYTTDTYQNEAGNQVTSYKNIEDRVSGVAKMEVVKDPSNQQVLSITIDSYEFNTLFTARAELRMNFEHLENELQLKDYSIKGGEKVIMKDTMEYTIKVKIGPLES
ncbi:hypothetical protein QQ020_29545 [Fulvivirgaceae bacterium BMA12]|uniref:Lipoprotein n=1 Tax=Agaribacillus aureus TaxID=3051825 RepID=A0ABT8LEP5_9BACT|nr:hypothetical protein [Fulvivirgaceae bacterium BMA12]